MSDRHIYVLGDASQYQLITAPSQVFPYIKGTFLQKGESVIFHFNQIGEYIGSVIGMNINPSQILQSQKVCSYIKQTA